MLVKRARQTAVSPFRKACAFDWLQGGAWRFVFVDIARASGFMFEKKLYLCPFLCRFIRTSAHFATNATKSSNHMKYKYHTANIIYQNTVSSTLHNSNMEPFTQKHQTHSQNTNPDA